jgi:pimeloyl-ACP methyl ester carboxylesterase
VKRQSDRPFEDPWPLPRWPDVPTRCVIGRRDRLFPADFQRRVIRERLGIVPDDIDAGHLPALSRPEELTRLLIGYGAEVESKRRRR